MNLYTPETFVPDGDWLNVPIDVYHTASNGLSSSMLSHLDPPARLPVYLGQKHQKDEWSIIGTLVHQRILEPSLPLPGIVLTPETYPGKTGPAKWTYQSSYCKEWRDEHESKGLIVLSQESYDTVIGCVQSIAARNLCRDVFLSSGVFELSCFGEFMGVRARIRPDFVPDKSNALVDLKTTTEDGTNDREWQKSVINFRYHVQAAFYLDVWNAFHPFDKRDAFCWIVVEKASPYLVSEFTATQELIEAGRYQYIQDLKVYSQCLASGQWLGHVESWRQVRPPSWMAKS
jgi:hypothetical protein